MTLRCESPLLVITLDVPYSSGDKPAFSCRSRQPIFTTSAVRSGNQGQSSAFASADSIRSTRSVRSLIAVERVNECEAFAVVDCRNRVMRVWCNRQSNYAVVGRAKDSMHIGRIWTVEEQKKSTVLVAPIPIQLDQEPVSFLSGYEVIMNSDSLTGNKLMSRQI